VSLCSKIHPITIVCPIFLQHSWSQTYPNILSSSQKISHYLSSSYFPPFPNILFLFLFLFLFLSLSLSLSLSLFLFLSLSLFLSFSLFLFLFLSLCLYLSPNPNLSYSSQLIYISTCCVLYCIWFLSAITVYRDYTISWSNLFHSTTLYMDLIISMIINYYLTISSYTCC